MNKDEQIMSLEFARRAAVAIGRQDPSKAGEAKLAGIALAEALVEGAKPCPGCGQTPHGMLQPITRDVEGVEIGCTKCRHHRAKKATATQAVLAWNAGVDAYTDGARFEWSEDGRLTAAVPGWATPRSR